MKDFKTDYCFCTHEYLITELFSRRSKFAFSHDRKIPRMNHQGEAGKTEVELILTSTPIKI